MNIVNIVRKALRRPGSAEWLVDRSAMPTPGVRVQAPPVRAFLDTPTGRLTQFKLPEISPADADYNERVILITADGTITQRSVRDPLPITDHDAEALPGLSSVDDLKEKVAFGRRWRAARLGRPPCCRRGSRATASMASPS